MLTLFKLLNYYFNKNLRLTVYSKLANDYVVDIKEAEKEERKIKLFWVDESDLDLDLFFFGINTLLVENGDSLSGISKRSFYDSLYLYYRMLEKKVNSGIK